VQVAHLPQALVEQVALVVAQALAVFTRLLVAAVVVVQQHPVLAQQPVWAAVVLPVPVQLKEAAAAVWVCQYF
jgi:hypothetical protein